MSVTASPLHTQATVDQKMVSGLSDDSDSLVIPCTVFVYNLPRSVVS